jgi:predicted esterase
MSRSANISEQYVSVERTARFVTMGASGERPGEVWFTCHGYGELASTFIRGLSALDDGTRLIVAPEALSRFYLDPPHGNVGASWMTREDRLNEISDYLKYLDAIKGKVLSGIDGGPVRVIVLGFSQGAATAARWACRSDLDVTRLVLWGESLPPELEDEESLRRLRSMQLTLVGGSRDKFFTASSRAELQERLNRMGVPFEDLTFTGGHRLDDATLLEIASR